MSNLTIHRLPTQGADEDLLKQFVARMKPLRLKSLQTDPGSWISRYESESVEPLDFWLGRLRESNAHHLVMVRHDKNPGVENLYALLNYEWVGFIVLIEVGKTSTSQTTREASDIATKPADWFMAAVYIDASCRGEGAGRNIVTAGIQLMEEQVRRSGKSSASCITSVNHGNDRALGLYKSLGFEVTNPDAIEKKEGREYHCTELMLRMTAEKE